MPIDSSEMRKLTEGGINIRTRQGVFKKGPYNKIRTREVSRNM